MKSIIIYLLFAAIALHSQETAQSWLQKMNDKYAIATSIQLEFEATYYSTHSMISAVNSMKGKVMYSGNNYYSDAMGQEIVMSKKSTLIIDRTEKTITVLPGSEKKKNDNSTASTQPDSTWLAATDITLLNTSGATRTVVIKEKNSIYEKTEVVINAVTLAMEKVTFYYAAMENGSKPSFVVKYSNVKFNESIPDSQFSEKKYIQRKGGTISPAAGWTGYTIIDLTDRYED